MNSSYISYTEDGYVFLWVNHHDDHRESYFPFRRSKCILHASGETRQCVTYRISNTTVITNKYICMSQPVPYITYRTLIAIHTFFYFSSREILSATWNMPPFVVRLHKAQWSMSTYFWFYLWPNDYANIQP